jgi:hypothetical protein
MFHSELVNVTPPNPDKSMKTFLLIIVFICTASNAFGADDWTYELSAEAKRIYKKKIIQYPCKNIPALLRQSMSPDFKQTTRGYILVPVQNDITNELYLTIRDAGLFRTKSCDAFIRRNVDTLNELPGVKDAIAFYYYRLGDRQQLNILATDFDKEARATGDYWTVVLFGFLDDWAISGVRLVQHAAYADAAGAESLCSAIMWRRYLYGEKNFKDNWYTVGEKEKVDKRRLDYYYETCNVEP